MPRSRKQVARFDPSPEAVAPWNDTSNKLRIKLEIEARVRHRLASHGAATLTAAAAQGKKEEQSEASRDPSGPAPTSSRKRQRSSSPKEAPGCSSISDLRPGRMSTIPQAVSPPAHPSTAMNGAPNGEYSLNESSLSCGTSDNEDESFSSESSVSHQNLPWRSAAAAVSEESASTGGGNSGIEGSTSIGGVSAGASDTDSELCVGLTSTLDATVSSSSYPESPHVLGDSARVSGGYLDCAGGKSDTQPKQWENNIGQKQQQPDKKARKVVTVRIARSQMPPRWAMPPTSFKTCLDTVHPEDILGEGLGDDAGLFALSEEDSIDSENWLCSGVIEVIMVKLARSYPNVHFMPVDFSVMCLSGWGSSTSTSDTTFHDILGRPIVSSEKKPVVFFTHLNNNHWNLLRVVHDPEPELQLFEPMGKPPRRTGRIRGNPGAAGSTNRGTGFRCIPKEVYCWLDTMWPLSSSSTTLSMGNKRKTPSSSIDGWASRTYSAITSQQQTTGFDCGVASLLYAEKCGQGEMREDVDAWTSQKDMTQYRQALQRYFKDILTNRVTGAQDQPCPVSCPGIAGYPAVLPSQDSPSMPQDPSQLLSSSRMGEPGASPVPREAVSLSDIIF